MGYRIPWAGCRTPVAGCHLVLPSCDRTFSAQRPTALRDEPQQGRCRSWRLQCWSLLASFDRQLLEPDTRRNSIPGQAKPCINFQLLRPMEANLKNIVTTRIRSSSPSSHRLLRYVLQTWHMLQLSGSSLSLRARTCAPLCLRASQLWTETSFIQTAGIQATPG